MERPIEKHTLFLADAGADVLSGQHTGQGWRGNGQSVPLNTGHGSRQHSPTPAWRGPFGKPYRTKHVAVLFGVGLVVHICLGGLISVLSSCNYSALALDHCHWHGKQ